MPFSCYENLVTAYTSIQNMAIVYDQKPVGTLAGAELENARTVIGAIARVMQPAVAPEFTRTAEIYAQLTHDETDYPLADKPRDTIRYKVMQAIRDDLREHGGTYEADVRGCIAEAMNVPEAGLEERLQTMFAALANESMQQVRTMTLVRGVVGDLRARNVTDKTVWAEPMRMATQTQERSTAIRAEMERIMNHLDSLKLIAVFKEIVK